MTKKNKEDKLTPRKLHKWYLEATKNLKPESYNPEAQEDFEDLDKEQKFIDEFICKKIKKTMIKKLEKEKTNGHTKTEQGFDRGLNFVIEELTENDKEE